MVHALSEIAVLERSKTRWLICFFKRIDKIMQPFLTEGFENAMM
jgi:hypothetical protein